jgi:hypothetical protein
MVRQKRCTTRHEAAHTLLLLLTSIKRAIHVNIMPPNIWLPTGHAAAARFLSHRAEALSLYREILRTAKHFHWCDEAGAPWNIRLRKQARQEFEASREETDPLILARLLVTGRDCVQQIQHKFNDVDRACWDRIKRDSNGRG